MGKAKRIQFVFKTVVWHFANLAHAKNWKIYESSALWP